MAMIQFEVEFGPSARICAGVVECRSYMDELLSRPDRVALVCLQSTGKLIGGLPELVAVEVNIDEHATDMVSNACWSGAHDRIDDLRDAWFVAHPSEASKAHRLYQREKASNAPVVL